MLLIYSNNHREIFTTHHGVGGVSRIIYGEIKDNNDNNDFNDVNNNANWPITVSEHHYLTIDAFNTGTVNHDIAIGTQAGIVLYYKYTSSGYTQDAHIASLIDVSDHGGYAAVSFYSATHLMVGCADGAVVSYQ